MLYQDLVDVYEKLNKTTKRLEKTFIISELLKRSPNNLIKDIIYLLQGNVFPQWDERKIGMSSMLIIKVIKSVTGTSEESIKKRWMKEGDLGLVAEELKKINKQTKLAFQNLTVEKVVRNLRKLSEMEGEGTVNRKVGLVSELLSHASSLEAKYVVKTVLDELRLGIAEGTMRDAIVWAFFPKIIGIFFKCDRCKKINPAVTRCLNCGEKINNKFKEEIEKKYPGSLIINSLEDLKKLKNQEFILTSDERLAREVYNKFIGDVQHAYNLTNDLGIVAEKSKVEGINSLAKLGVEFGTPVNPMLAIKAINIHEALKSLGKPVLADWKLDGFRCQIHKRGDEILLFTRRLENVTKQFPEIIPLVKRNIKGESFILDSELVGFDPKTKKYKPFQEISQRIRRKYNIEQMAKNLPVEINIFDIMFYEGKTVMDKPQSERRKLIERIVNSIPWKIKVTEKIISGSEKELEDFYNQALKAGVEGLILKNMKKPYTPGRKVGGWMKIKPTLEPLDLVIVGATYGEGKRAHLLSSFILACRSGDSYLKCGMVGTGIKEKEEESGVTFAQLTNLLKPLITKIQGRYVEIKPKIVVEVGYEEIQKSTNYESGFALRFPRFLRLRNDEKRAKDANTLADLKHIYLDQHKLESKKK